MPAIELINLSKFFGPVSAVLEANLTVGEGECFGFVGPNGSGKSTTIRILLNYLRPTSGSAKIFGLDVVKDSARIKQFTGYIPSDVDYCEDMHAMEVIRYCASFHKEAHKENIAELCELFEVDTHRRIGKMSMGNRKKIALVTALLGSPRLLILDEASLGLDSLIKKRFIEKLKQMNRQGTTIFFCSHDMAEVQDLCGRTGIIRKGSILEINETNALAGSTSRRIRVKTGQDLSAAYEVLRIKDILHSAGYENFLYRDNINLLLQALRNYELDDLQIGLPSLEDAIVRFYEKEMEKEEMGQ